MAASISRLAPVAAQSAPDQETRELGTKVLRLELEAQQDAGLAALLQHEIARLNECREDLAAAARDELSTTKKAAGFVEPIESLIDIATRSRSKANLVKLLERLSKLAQGDDEKLRASLALALTHLSNEDAWAARGVLEHALEETPTESVLWISLEAVAAATSDPSLLLRAATGRAAHAKSEELRCLLLERVARLQMSAGNSEEAFAALRQSVDEFPTWRALHAWEELGQNAQDYEEARKAAIQTSTILRAGLEEPEEAALYQIPDEELSEQRAVAAHVRAIIHAVRALDDPETRRLCEQLCEASPQSAFALALLSEICRKQGDVEGAHAAAARLLEARKWNTQEQSTLLALCALTARACENDEEVSRCLSRLSTVAPKSLLPHLHQWLEVCSRSDPSDLAALFATWARSEGLTDGGSASAFLYGAALIKLLLGETEEATALLENAPVGESAVGDLLRYVIDEVHPDDQRRLTLPPRIGSRSDQLAVAWEALRVDLKSSRETPSESVEAMKDARKKVLSRISAGGGKVPWARLSLALLHDDIVGSRVSSKAVDPTKDDTDGVIFGLTNEADEPAPPESAAEVELAQAARESFAVTDASALRSQVEDYLGTITEAATASVSGALSRALEVLLIAGFGEENRVRERWAGDAQDPLITGAMLAILEKEPNVGGDLAPRAKALSRAAQNIDDGALRAAWHLKSASLSLAAGDVASSQAAIKMSGAFPNDSSLSRWLRAFFGPCEPQVDLARLDESGTWAEDDLDRAALIRRWARERWPELSFSSPSPPLQILRVLTSAVDSLEALEYALDDTVLFNEAERAVLSLARKFELDEASELLAASTRWARTCSSSAAYLTTWIAATRASDFSIQAQMIERLSQSLSSEALLLAIPASLLKKDARVAHLDRLREVRGRANEAQKKSLSWAIFEQMGDEISALHAKELRHLASDIDEGLEDPDAQGALLIAGYEYLISNESDEAIALFEKLLKVIPGDLALCHGARLAAIRSNRPDIEATTSCEIARFTDDNVKSADLWERAGVLYQDELGNPEEAERCFTAALSRSPGSRHSFERLYRFARSRNDRARQVELIDARLDTADTESLLIELYWEKARFCRMLGRRTIALRSVDELLKLAPSHLPALALVAELYLVDGRTDAAAEALRAVAMHPDTPPAERSLAGLHACDLFEQLKRPRDSVDLLRVLDEYGVSGNAGLERRARSLARSSDWGEAYKAFAQLNDEQDEIETRLESARMMLAIQRDHLREPEELKRAARCVLRDAPLDSDAIKIVLEQPFPLDERRRLLTAARGESQSSLRRFPLNPPEIRRFADLCWQCGDDPLERVALGNLGLTGKLSPDHGRRLEALCSACLPMPSQPLSQSDLEAIADPLQLGATGRYLTLVARYLAPEIEPSLDALGLSSLMRSDEFSGSAHRAEIGTWVSCFGHNDFELYVGGHHPRLIRGIHGDLPTIIVGRDVPVPLTDFDRGRVVAQLAALHFDSAVLLNHPAEELEKWLLSSEILVGADRPSPGASELDEMARSLSKVVPREVREELAHLHDKLSSAGVEVSRSAFVVMRGATRAACLAHGHAMIARDLTELLPSDQDLLNTTIADLIKFVLAPEFINIRRKIGLEGA